MNNRSKTLLLCAATLALAASASARDWGYRSDFSASYSRDTGGYCDDAGCPDHFWTYPIFYGPVYFHGIWYRGPVYTRDDSYGHHWFWIRGAWRRDEWRHPRPYWARNVHFGPPLDFAFYESHGFNVEGRWRQEHDAWAWSHRENPRGYYSQGGYSNNGEHGPQYNQGPGERDQRGAYDQGYRQGPPPDQYSQNGPPPNGYDYGRENGGGRDYGNGDHGWNGYDRGWRGDHGPGQQTAQNNGSNPSGNAGGPPNATASNGPAPNQITVTSATYGASCHQPKGNVTKFLQDACNGQAKCDYTVKYQTIGDPAPGCSKDFSVEWTCSNGPGSSASAPAEAGFGSKVTLQCGQGGRG